MTTERMEHISVGTEKRGEQDWEERFSVETGEKSILCETWGSPGRMKQEQSLPVIDLSWECEGWGLIL